MQARMRAAEFNACPMPRKYDFDVMSAVPLLDPHVIFGNGDRFAVMAALEASAQRPAEEQHFEPREGQDRPVAAEGHEARDAEGGQAHRAEEHERPARAQGAVRNDLDSLLQGTGHAGKSYPSRKAAMVRHPRAGNYRRKTSFMRATAIRESVAGVALSGP